MLAATIEGEKERQWKKKIANKNTCDISSIKGVTGKFHVVVVQNMSKEIKKCECENKKV